MDQSIFVSARDISRYLHWGKPLELPQLVDTELTDILNHFQVAMVNANPEPWRDTRGGVQIPESGAQTLALALLNSRQTTLMGF